MRGSICSASPVLYIFWRNSQRLGTEAKHAHDQYWTVRESTTAIFTGFRSHTMTSVKLAIRPQYGDMCQHFVSYSLVSFRNSQAHILVKNEEFLQGGPTLHVTLPYCSARTSIYRYQMIPLELQVIESALLQFASHLLSLQLPFSTLKLALPSDPEKSKPVPNDPFGIANAST